MDKTYLEALETWRAEMDSNLRAPYSWLALAGLFWLREGANPLGSAPESRVQLPARAPARAGSFHLAGGQVTVELAPGVDATINEGEPLPLGAVLHNDHDPAPDYLFVGSLRMLVVLRGGKPAIRLWDPEHPARLNFQGRKWYAPDPAYRVVASIEHYEPAKQVMIDDMIGNQNPGEMQAALVFKLHGQQLRLDAELRATGLYSIVFKDATAGQGSYPAARFLTSEIPDGDTVVLDFNRAYSPPCAFTDFATCPLPIPENVLPAKIEAGEKFEGKG